MLKELGINLAKEASGRFKAREYLKIGKGINIVVE